MDKDKIRAGAIIKQRDLPAINSRRIRVPDREKFVHLQFRRFAGCPVCDLHLRTIAQRHSEIAAASILEVVVFHSRAEELVRYAGDLPFAVIPDPGKRLYADFRVESGRRALIDPRSWMPIVRGLLRSLCAILRGGPIPPLNPEGGRFGLPADFFIASDGRVLACKYGAHAYDQWSVDEILALSRAGDEPAKMQSPSDQGIGAKSSHAGVSHS